MAFTAWVVYVRLMDIPEAGPIPHDRGGLASLLTEEGFIAADEEAGELLAFASGDAAILQESVARRLTGEPLAWIVGSVTFCGQRIRVDRGVYVPRWHTELLARRAVDRLPMRGTAIDVCTGSGAVAKTLMSSRPHARVVACDIDERAVACARANGVETFAGDLYEPLPDTLEGRVDVIVGVVPYVPAADLAYLQRDTFTFESPLAYDGGADGTDVLRRAVAGGVRFLRPGGALLLELGGGQADALTAGLAGFGFRDVDVLRDEEGDVRGVEATLRTSR
jgi:release factor glutamine methyltransferase